MTPSLDRTAFILVGILVLSPAVAFITPSSSRRVVIQSTLPRHSKQQQQQYCFITQSSPSPILWHPNKESSCCTMSTSLFASLSSSDSDGDTDPETIETTAVNEVSETTGKKRLWERIVSLYKKSPKDDDNGLTFRQKLSKAGLSVVLSYGWVSNMSYCVSVSAAWYIFCQRTRLSPLAQGQWPKFLAVYSGFWVFNNIVRPIRFALSVAISTQFDNIVTWIQKKANVGKGVAVGLTVFLANVVGTTTLMCAGIALAASLAGVPIFPPK